MKLAEYNILIEFLSVLTIILLHRYYAEKASKQLVFLKQELNLKIIRLKVARNIGITFGEVILILRSTLGSIWTDAKFHFCFNSVEKKPLFYYIMLINNVLINNLKFLQNSAKIQNIKEV